MAGAKLLRGTDHRAVPWKNGAGTTREIAVHSPSGGGPGAFGWRISIAVITGAAPFSRFPGIDRYLTALSPAGLALTDSGRPVELRRYDVYAFAGENIVESVLLPAASPSDDSPPTDAAEPSLDLNLMVRRDLFTGTLRIVRVVEPWSAQPVAVSHGATVVVVLSGGLYWQGRALAEHDALIGSAGELLRLTGTGVIAVAVVLPR
jgi:environmental stress-induced protein Ves